MKWYFLALLIWITIILLIVSIVGIPIYMYLRDTNDWFESPFNTAYWRKCY